MMSTRRGEAGSVLLWGKKEGYRSANLGLTPYVGFEKRSKGSPLSRLGGVLFPFADEFETFDELRTWKAALGSAWRPRYLAAPGGTRLPYVTDDIVALVSRGPPGVDASQV